MKKRSLTLILAVLLLTGLGGCGRKPAETQPPQDQVELTYYTIGRADPDLPLVNAELNSLLSRKYGFTVDYRKIDWNDYESTVNGILGTNQNFDVMFTWDTQYVKHALNGAFLDLEPYLQDEGRELYEAVDPKLWNGVRVEKKIWGVPTNKELAPVLQFVFSRDLVEKYQVDIEAYSSLEELEPLLTEIAQQEPQVVPLLFTSERVDMAELLGFEYVVGGDLPLVVRRGDPECRVENIYETREMQDLQATLRRFYENGLINADATVRTGISRFSSEQVFCRIATGGPMSQESFAMDFGYPVVCRPLGKPWITNTTARGGIMAVNAHTAHPREAMTFLAAVNLDPEVRNLLNFGVEGIHYTLTDRDQVRVISDGYRGVPYTQGNWFILKTTQGEPEDKWQIYRDYNAQAETSLLLGFQPKLRSLEQECLEVSKVYRRYDNALLTGSVVPAFRIVALQQMELAGVDQLQRSLQTQVDSWLRDGTVLTEE